jgi:diguanylate cyclase (GGDEF)-like protein
MPDAGSRIDIEGIAERLLREIEQPIALASGHYGQLSASLGIALAPEHGRDVERLLVLADHAMYEAKVSGKNTWAFAGAAGSTATVTPIGVRALRAT